MRRPGAPSRLHCRQAAIRATVLALATMGGVSGASGQTVLLDRGGTVLDLGGYARSLAALTRLDYEIPGRGRSTTFNADVLRLRWNLRLGEHVTVLVHERAQLQLSSEPLNLGTSVAGFGVSAVPDRSVDLETRLLDRERAQAWHDVDRLALTVRAGRVDVTAGRQAITWGISTLFPVADLWARFSPFELDTEEKPGIDALRVLAYPRPGWELDAVVADRGSLDDLSAGVRATVTLPWADLHVAGGKFWREVLFMAGIAAPIGSWKLRAEGVLPRDLDTDAWARPRVTLGTDWLGGEWVVSGEYHLNGIGATDPSKYPDVLADPRFARGESYYLGRHYLGMVALYAPGNDRLSLALNAMANLGDPSLALTPSLTYDLGQDLRLSAGGLWTLGDAPMPEDGGLRFRSEFGAYGSLLFAQASLYF